MSEAEEVKFVCQPLNEPEVIDLTDDGTEERMDHTIDDRTEERMDHTTDVGTEERMDRIESIEYIDLSQDDPPQKELIGATNKCGEINGDTSSTSTRLRPDAGSSTVKLQTVSKVDYKYDFPTPLLEYLDLTMLRATFLQIQKLFSMAKVMVDKEFNDLHGKTPATNIIQQEASPSSLPDIEQPLSTLKRMSGEVSGTYTTQENVISSHSAEFEASMPDQSAEKNIQPGIALKEKDEVKKIQKNTIFKRPSPRYQSDARIPKVGNEHPKPEIMTARNHATQSAKRHHSPKSVNYSSKKIKSDKSHGSTSTKEIGIVKNAVLPGISLMDPRRKAIPIGTNKPLTEVSDPPSKAPTSSSLRNTKKTQSSIEKTNAKKNSSRPTKKIGIKAYKLLKGVPLTDPRRKDPRKSEVSAPPSSIPATSSPRNSSQNVFKVPRNTASSQNVGNKVTVYSDAVASNIPNCPQPYPRNSSQNVFNSHQNSASTQNVGNPVTVYADAGASNIFNCAQPYSNVIVENDVPSHTHGYISYPMLLCLKRAAVGK